MLIAFASLLIAQAALPLPGASPNATIEHKPVEKATRGQPVTIKAVVHDTNAAFAPLVFARASNPRFSGFPMVDRGHDNWVAHLPQSLLTGARFEYFIEGRLPNGDRTTSGSATHPYVVEVEEAQILPAKVAVNSDAEGGVISLDGKEVGKAPITLEMDPGRHTVSVQAQDGRGAEQQIEAIGGKLKKIFLTLPRIGGAGTLSVVSEPPAARVYLDGKRIGETPLSGELAAGPHKLAVERDGFLRQEREVNFKEGHDVELTFSLVPLPKDPALSIESVPPGALVFIDGVQKGLAPWVGPLGTGRHEAVLKLAGRREIASDFVMPEGHDLSLRLELPPVAKNEAPRLVITSKPDGATVKIDGVEVGSTPWSGEVKPGTRKLSLALDGYLAEDRDLVAKANREMESSFTLQRLPGPAQLAIETEPTGAEVSVDGVAMGTTPLDQQIPLTPGEHQIAARRKGYLGVAQSVVAEQGQSMSLRLALAAAPRDPSPPIIAVATEPAGAQLYVDGKLQGETPFKVKSSPGPHEIRVTLDGYISRRAKITLPTDSGFELRIAVSLKRTREAEAQEKPDPLALARAQLKRAQACYKQGDWACALVGYQAAYEFKPVPDLLFNIAQSRRKQDQLREAALAYRAYLREKPNGALAGEAERLARQCEDALAGGHKKVAEEDTQPPVLRHTPLPRATRGEDLRVAAIISDDRSGVFNPQVCYRNLFSTEFTCVLMDPSSAKDEYAAVVPGKAVRDGFSYFVEAYDNAGNGPARSGQPTAPNSVAIEEKSAGGSSTIIASHVMDGTMGGAPMVLVPMMAPSVREQHRPWDLVVHAGAEQSVERYTDGIVMGSASIALSRQLKHSQEVRVELGARLGRQPYHTQAPVPGQATQPNQLSEQRYSASAAWGADLAALLLKSERLSVTPMVAVVVQRFQNEVTPNSYFGPGAELLARFALNGPLALIGSGLYSWNLLANSTPNAVGQVRGNLALRAGLEIAIPGRHTLELDYTGDVVTLNNDYRLSNGLTVGFGSSF
jgi:hypothetical protein